ncbi:MAG: hypothetical protein JNK79_10100 [Chitinophagaceae bacterium]|nr:hypothetical protein [Chitinophagaceae bacterium]
MIRLSLLWALAFCSPLLSISQFKMPASKEAGKNVVPVSKPGSYAQPGTTYMLVNDISSPQTAIFLGKDVTLDLNGHTIRYADGNYEHIRNKGFEEGTTGWDLSKAPGANVVNTREVHVFIGDKILSLKKGDEITSSYVNLPLGNRSYFAMCGVTGFDYHAMNADLKNQMKVSIYVEDENGKEVTLVTEYKDTTMQSSPLIREAPELGGGFLYAHLNKIPAGKYRVRVKAETDCLVDEIDIRPAMDAGIGIVSSTSAMGSYYHLANCGHRTAFFDYTADVKNGTPISGIPVVNGTGTITIKNGTIENATEGILSWGIQSTANDVRIILDNVKIKTAGINSVALEIPQATIVNCRFEVDNPFIINRHCSFSAANITGREPSEISYSEFIGGQGCLFTHGRKTNIHHNLFVNRQTVTNHYSVAINGEASRVFENIIEPEMGSGIWPSQNCEIFNNTIRIKTSPPTCEYGHEEYSVNAIRMADYHRKPGAPDGTFGNKVYNNKIYITANDFPDAHPGYIPMAFGVFYSVAGGEDDVFGNDIVIEKTNPNSKTISTGLYICGGAESLGGNFYNNRITSNVPGIWVATMYGGAGNTKIFNNTLVKSANASDTYKPFRMGWAARDVCVAKNIQLKSNKFEGSKFDIDIDGKENSFNVYWTLNIKVLGKASAPVKNREIKISDKTGQVVLTKPTDENGTLAAELLQFSADGETKKFSAPYTISIGKQKIVTDLTENTDLVIHIKK